MLPLGQNLSGPSRDREYQPRERRVNQTHASVSLLVFPVCKYEFYLQDGSEDPPGPIMQKTPIILAKPPSDRVNLYNHLPLFIDQVMID